VGHGFCVLQRPENTRLLHDVLTLYIDDICVDEAARGQGAGRAIYGHILAFARQKGCYNVTLNVWSCNPGAMEFYKKLGLTPYKVGMEQIL
jgi:ribosomal protein S18 acetylase RimI-like enzyme